MLWELTKPIQARASKPDTSDNGTNHCLYVELYIWRLLHETQQHAKFTATELFLLSCSACCHDLDRGLKTCLTDGAQHGEGSGEFVVNYHGELVVTRPHAIAVEYIVSIHDKKGAEYSDLLADLPEAYSLSTGPVDLQRLAVLLKAADTLHTDNTRITELGTDAVKLAGLDQTKHLFRQCISGWRTDGNRIVLSACPDSQEQWEALLKGKSFIMDREWSTIADSLHRYNFPYKLEFDIDDHLLCRKATQEAPRDLPGMDYYHEEDAALLAGRDAEIRDLEQQVLGTRSSLLIGPSGVGKSSVLHAGLAPRIRQFSGWGVVVTRPDKITGAFFTPGDFRHIIDFPINDGDDFGELCRRAFVKYSRLLVVLDQFEDIAYFGAFDGDAIALPVLDALSQNRHLTVLFSYRDDVESVMLPLWQLISHTAAGLPKHAMRRLGRSGAEASLKRLLGTSKVSLDDEESFLHLLLDELSTTTSREAGFTGETIYPPFIQMVVQRLAELAEQGHVCKAKYEELASAGRSATDQVIAQFLTQSIKDLPKYGFAEEDGRRVLVALAHSSGKKGSADEARIAAETHVSPEKLSGLLAHMAKMRLARRMESGHWEIMHDLMAKSAIEGLVSEEDRRFKQVREILDAKAHTFDQYHDALAQYEINDLWTKREQLPPEHLRRQEPAVILLSMATMEPADMANAGNGYGHDIEDVRGELTDPARWSAPGWYWLSALKREDLLGLAQAAGKIGQIGGAVAYVRIASLIALSADVEGLANLLLGPFLGFPRLAEDTIVCMASLATETNLPLLRRMAKHEWPIVRRAAAKALGNVGTQDDLAILGEMAGDEYPRPGAAGDVSVRDAVAEAVGKLGYRKGLQILQVMVHDEWSDVLPAVAQAIARLGDAEGLPLLEGLAKANYSPVQHIAARCFAEQSSHGDLALLREAAKDKNAVMQRGVAWVLKERGGQEDLPLLREMMKSSDRNVQYAAVAAIGKLGNAEDLPFLRQLATSTGGHWPIRQCAVRAIATIGEHEDFALLRDVAVRDEVKHIVGRTASRVCWQLATREDIPMLEERLRRGGSLEVLQAVISAMARQYRDDEMLTAMSAVMLNYSAVVAKMAADLAVPRASEQQLQDFLARYQQKLSPQVLAVFDWRLFSPPYLKDAYERWRKDRDKMPSNRW